MLINKSLRLFYPEDVHYFRALKQILCLMFQSFWTVRSKHNLYHCTSRNHVSVLLLFLLKKEVASCKECVFPLKVDVTTYSNQLREYTV